MNTQEQMDAIKDSVSMSIYGRNRSECLKTDTCVACGNRAAGFKDAVSRREYQISAMCQVCQDDTFN